MRIIISKYLVIIMSLLIFILYGCSKHSNNLQLQQIVTIVEEDPRLAKSMLDSIDKTKLNRSDEALYNLMTVKTNSRLFVRHTSDSLILKVVDYYQYHDKNFYPEALYYAGEVYEEMGDTPKALKYLRTALSHAHPDDLLLRSRILGHILNMLNSMRLYDQAVPYALEVIKIDQNAKQYDYLVESHHGLGYIHLNRESYDSAEYEYSKAAEIAHRYKPEYEPTERVYLALIKFKKNKIDSALYLLRPEIDRVDSITRNAALNIGCRIYHEAGIRDTAYMYAHELINSNMDLGKMNGYKILLSPDMVEYSPVDSLVKYATDYRRLIEKQMDTNGDEMAFVQTAVYNYQLHDRERGAADKRASLWLRLLAISLVLSLGMIIYFLYRRNKYNLELLNLREAIDLMQKINSSDPSSDSDKNTGNPLDNPENNAANTGNDRESLKKKLRSEILTACRNNREKAAISPTMTSSDTYRRILEHLENGTPIPDSSPLWQDIDKMVSESYPSFKSNLNILCDGKLNNKNYRVALLIKCGMKPLQSSELLGRSKNAISYHRSTLCKVILEGEKDLSLLDQIIPLL